MHSQKQSSESAKRKHKQTQRMDGKEPWDLGRILIHFVRAYWNVVEKLIKHKSPKQYLTEVSQVP